MSRLLEVTELHLAFDSGSEPVRNVSLHIDRGEIVGIAGPSGSGKSMTMWSLLGLLPDKCHMSGSLSYYNAEGTVVHITRPSDARALSGKKIGMIPQNPFTSLNPVYRCGMQINEMLMGATLTQTERKDKVCRHLTDLGFRQPEQVYHAYPFELSGGQLQRVVIAMATIAAPELLIADEPTTALDILTQADVLGLLDKWVRTGNKSMFLVSHDVTLLQRYCDRIYVIQQGEMAYSGLTPDVMSWIKQQHAPITPRTPLIKGQEQGLCNISGLHVRYQSRSGELVNAVRDLSLQIGKGETVGLVGSTGCGKSTVAKVLTGLVQPLSGTLSFLDKSLDFDRYPELRKHIQMIFQDPYSALYPHLPVGAYLREAIRHHRITQRSQETDLIHGVLERVGLVEDFVQRYPYQLSGGERQRVQIARAVLIRPTLLICDEITSGLDAQIQGQILQLLQTVHQQMGMAMLMISHDLNVIRYMADRVLVMDSGRIIEESATNALFSQPQHEVTRALLKAQISGVRE